MQIFLIEDDTVYAEFLKKALAQNPEYHINAFFNAEDAYAAISEKLPDAFIIDYKLPGMTGIELFEKIKDRLTEQNKLILMSAIDDGNMVLSFIQKGVRDYVIKDENVIDSLRAVLEGNEDDSYFFN